MRTRLTDLLEIEHPVMLAGMGGVAYSKLVAAVSNAGGYGCLGASTMSSERLTHEIAATDNAGYRASLQQQRQVLAEVGESLGRMLSSAPADAEGVAAIERELAHPGD